MIKLLGIVPTKRAVFDEQGEQISPAEFNDHNYYAMSTSKVDGLAEVDKPALAPVFAGVESFYYAFADEAEAKELLEIEDEDAAH